MATQVKREGSIPINWANRHAVNLCGASCTSQRYARNIHGMFVAGVLEKWKEFEPFKKGTFSIGHSSSQVNSKIYSYQVHISFKWRAEKDNIDLRWYKLKEHNLNFETFLSWGTLGCPFKTSDQIWCQMGQLPNESLIIDMRRLLIHHMYLFIETYLYNVDIISSQVILLCAL